MQRLPGSLNLGFAGVPPGKLLMAMPQLAVSAGSACAAGSAAPSTVLAALGVPPDLAAASMRLCFARDHTEEDAVFAATVVADAVTRLRASHVA